VELFQQGRPQLFLPCLEVLLKEGRKRGARRKKKVERVALKRKGSGGSGAE
jgi:hypothetical protein